MAGRGAPKGNQHAARGKYWRDTIDWALRNYEGSAVERGQALRKIAFRLIESALEGDHAAIREIGDRLDGKPAQSHEVEANINDTRERSKTEVAARLLSLLEGARDGEESRDVH